MQVKLTVENLCLQKNKKAILNNISLELLGGKIFALVGANGAGKTTFLKCLVGLEPHAYKSVHFNNIEVAKIDKITRSKKFSLLTQNSSISISCLAKYRIAHGLIPNYGFSSWLNQAQNEKIYEISNKLGIQHLLDRPLNLMSGGEQRLVHIAKCIVNSNIELLLLDEPSVFLDFNQKMLLVKTILSLKSPNRIIIFSSHDSSFIKNCADKILALENGFIKIFSNLAEVNEFE